MNYDLILNEEDTFKQELLMSLSLRSIPPENVSVEYETLDTGEHITAIRVKFNEENSIYCAWRGIGINNNSDTIEKVTKRIVDMCVARNFINE